MKKERKTRYTLQQNGEVLGKTTSIAGIAEIVGCTLQHVYQRLTIENTFTYKKITYEIVDKLA